MSDKTDKELEALGPLSPETEEHMRRYLEPDGHCLNCGRPVIRSARSRSPFPPRTSRNLARTSFASGDATQGGSPERRAACSLMVAKTD
jgi:hypothetical protein